jgi:hypothetical protein
MNCNDCPNSQQKEYERPHLVDGEFVKYLEKKLLIQIYTAIAKTLVKNN